MTGTENGTSNQYRRVKDKAAKFVIVGGGVFVLLTLLLIFCYLIYVTFPILRSAQLHTHALEPVANTVDDVRFNPRSNKLIMVGQTQSRSRQQPESMKDYYAESLLAASASDIILQRQQRNWKIQSTANAFEEAGLPASLSADIPDHFSATELLSANLSDAHITEKHLGWAFSDGQKLGYRQRSIKSDAILRDDLDIQAGIDQLFLNTQLTMLTVRSSQRMLIYHIKANGLSLLYEIDLNAFLPSRW